MYVWSTPYCMVTLQYIQYGSGETLPSADAADHPTLAGKASHDGWVGDSDRIGTGYDTYRLALFFVCFLDRCKCLYTVYPLQTVYIFQISYKV